MTEPTATEFTPVYTWFAGNGGYYAKDVSQTTSTAVFFEMKTRGSTGSDTTPAWMVGQYGIEFRYENGNTVLYCNTGDNTDIPYTFANGAVTQTLTSNNIGDTITATLNGGTAYTFTVTAGMLWTASTSTSGGTSTEGSSVPRGSQYINAQGQLVFVINSGSPSSDGNIAYKIFRRLKGGTLQQAYVVPHTQDTSANPTDTSFNIGLNLSLYDKWELRVESNTALVQSAVLAVHTNIKKVFCNF